ncbi:Inosine-uridine preferring nucleoside hydrolase [Maioricimonas rarisocia]|uniref:Inosine-uridine preferring nucleoside hydrolase n=1 Tax=Maioricimonas rarisocia TaxID=2528026 RepID=A0A517ZFH5_9PLAN|nr:nucleoside hydrolase [Maioricimonas rarisocia]QDU41189.1 Inosine-uridine preferring nucleoside hydrolase [Maioricimonas rarisocia]
MRVSFLTLLAVIAMCATHRDAAAQTAADEPVPFIFDTDIGNDVDDVLALGMIHALEARGECRLLAVTVTKDHELAAPFVDAVNTFYGRGDVPIGVVRDGVTPATGRFNILADQKDDGQLRYPHDLMSGADAPDAVTVLRKALAGEEDGTVVMAQVGFSTNFARLLDSKPDDVSPLSGRELVAKKVRLLSIMAGAFELIKGKIHPEYNVIKDIPSAQKLAEEWPTPVIFSGYEIGLSIPYPSESILKDYDYVEHHPLAEAYHLYIPPPHNRPTWDLTSVLYGIRPDRGYFDLSPEGRVTIDDKGVTTFEAQEGGPHRYLIASPEQKIRVTEVQVQLASQPPVHNSSAKNDQ